jgi:hypothetical protein
MPSNWPDDREIKSKDGKITQNPLQDPEPDEEGEPFPATVTTDPWGITDGS